MKRGLTPFRGNVGLQEVLSFDRKRGELGKCSAYASRLEFKISLSASKSRFSVVSAGYQGLFQWA